MKAKTFGFVASLIATLTLLGASQAVHAQAQAGFVWGPQDLTTMVDYKIDQIAIPFGSQNIAPNHRVAVVETKVSTLLGAPMSEPALLDELARRCNSDAVCLSKNWARTGRTWLVFKLGTPGTVPVSRFYMPGINSHVFVAANEKLGGESALIVLRRLSQDFIDDGEQFAIVVPLAGYASGDLPLSQACGEESQTGLTAMLRLYNNGFSKSGVPSNIPMAVRFNDGNHLFTTRTDVEFVRNQRTVPGWEISALDTTTNRGAGVWCIPATLSKFVQTMVTSSADMTLTAQTHDASRFVLNGSSINLLPGTPMQYRVPFIDETLTGLLGIDSNRGIFSVARAGGGFVEFGGLQNVSQVSQALPTGSTLTVNRSAFTVAYDSAPDDPLRGHLVYIASAFPDFKIQAYDPKTNSYVWDYTMPAEYSASWNRAVGKFAFAGNYLITHMNRPINNWADGSNGALIIVKLGGSGPRDVRIIPINEADGTLSTKSVPTDFIYDGVRKVGTWSDSLGRRLIHVDFTTWQVTHESLPFQPHALLAPTTGELYVTDVPYLGYVWPYEIGRLMKRASSTSPWVLVSEAGHNAFDLRIINVAGVPKVAVFNAGCRTECDQIDFFDLKTNIRVPTFARQLFGELNWRNDLGVVALRQ